MSERGDCTLKAIEDMREQAAMELAKKLALEILRPMTSGPGWIEERRKLARQFLREANQ